MMLAAARRLAGCRRRGLLLVALGLGAVGLSAAPALAAPTWGITMAHANAYGLPEELIGCPGGHESLEPDCGVDPFSGSGMNFARESGFDGYTIKVTNTSSEAIPSNKVGSTLRCVAGPSSGPSLPSLAYQWLRNGVAIGGASAVTYKLEPADEGSVIQCEVTASDSNGATAAVSEGAAVSPSGGEEVMIPATGRVEIESHAGKWLVGETVTCKPAEETSGTYQWLRNGVAIAGATAEKYKLAMEDEGKALQCEETETAASGSAVTMSSSSKVVVAGVAGGNDPPLPAAEALLPVATVEDQLPAGIVLTGVQYQLLPIEPSPSSNWVCKVLHGSREGKAFEGPSAFRCWTSDSLEPGQSYKPITASVNVTPRAVNPSTNVATVSGGGTEASASSGGKEGETPITPAVPFGIHCFAVSILEESQYKESPTEKTCEEAKSKEETEIATKPIPAGGHPFSEGTEFLLNYTTSSGETTLKTSETPLTPRLVSADGGPKEVEAELPPGVVGNPQNVPECTFAELQTNNKCPEDTAVGYTWASIDTGQIEGGKAQPFFTTKDEQSAPHSLSHALIYNLQPPPGHPAEFGFLALSRVPIVLEAKLRSNGDYGVSVGDSAVAEKVVGVRATFCEFGAHKEGNSSVEFYCNHKRVGLIGNLESEQKTIKGLASTSEILAGMEVTGTGIPTSTRVSKVLTSSEVEISKAVEEGKSGTGVALTFGEAPLDAKPFLTNPTECSSTAPIWVLRSNPWDEPADVASQPTAMNPVAECDKLQLNPELGFEPSPPEFKPGSTVNEGGTSQADEPTGMKVNLTVPQTNEVKTPHTNEQSRATPELKNVRMTLPEGLTVSPSAADGLEACSDAQFGLGTEFGPGAPKVVPEPPAQPAKCPHESQIGTVEVFTPLLSGAPVVEGTLAREKYEHERVTCAQGAWSGGPWSRSKEQFEAGAEEVENGNHERLKLSYQWLRDGVAIEGEGAKEEIYAFTPTTYQEDKGKAIQCQVTATSAAGSSVSASRDVVVPPESSLAPPFPPSSIAAPSGTASVGNTLTCAAGAWTTWGSKTVEPKFTDAWLRNGVPIGAEGEAETYKLTSADEGKVIQCQVTGTNASGSVRADSAAVVVASSLPHLAPPLPGAALQGQLFVATPECSPCTNADAEDGKLFRLFLQVQDPSAGVIVKLHGINRANTLTGQLKSEFVDQPQQPFELLQLKLKGGPRAPLANPQGCGTATTTADLTPWSEPFTPDAKPTSSFNVEGCAPSFNPSFNAGTIGPQATTAGAYTAFSLTFGRNDREQDLSGLQVRMPLGLVGKIAGLARCGEAEVQAAEHNAGGCPAASKIGTATSLAGPGPDPFQSIGHAYFTGPYRGAPFGIVVVTPAVAGPFNLGNVVVRSTINIDPHTAAVTVTSDPLPQFRDGVQLRLRQVNVNVSKPGFMLNPTSCSAQQVGATLSSAQGAAMQVASPFGLGGCKTLPFAPTFTATTDAHATKAGGASLNVKITYPPGAYANIAKSVTELPAALPSRLTTIQQACRDTVFEANPAACDEGSVVGYATAHTPLLDKPLTGPAYLVSHGNAAFPDLEIVLQGEGITVVLDGQTDIKGGVTKTTFNAVPDSPVSTFELILPEGPHSALAANGNLCTTSLKLPTILTGQNGAVVKQNTNIAVTGCPPTITISKIKVVGNALLVTVRLSATGTVKISGKGLKTTTKRSLKAGTRQIRVALTKTGRSMRKHRKKTTVHVSLTVGKQVAAKATSLRL